MKHLYKFESFLNEGMQDRDLETFVDSLETEIVNLDSEDENILDQAMKISLEKIVDLFKQNGKNFGPVTRNSRTGSYLAQGSGPLALEVAYEEDPYGKNSVVMKANIDGDVYSPSIMTVEKEGGEESFNSFGGQDFRYSPERTVLTLDKQALVNHLREIEGTL
jgi:hypothetical protein